MTIFAPIGLHLKFIRFFTNLLVPKNNVLEKCTFTIDELSVEENRKKASKCLNKYSFFVIPKFIDKSFLKKKFKIIEDAILREYKNYNLDEREAVEKDLFNISCRDAQEGHTYYYCKMLNRNVGYDVNFFEVVNYNKSTIKELKQEDLLEDLINYRKSFNIYTEK